MKPAFRHLLASVALASLLAVAGVSGAAGAPPPATEETKPPAAAHPAGKALSAADLAGTYRCRSYNVGGAGGRPPVGTPPLVLNADGTYAMSREHGTFRVTGDKIVLSESKIRGPGKLGPNHQIVFEYDYNGLHHVVTYWRQ